MHIMKMGMWVFNGASINFDKITACGVIDHTSGSGSYTFLDNEQIGEKQLPAEFFFNMVSQLCYLFIQAIRKSVWTGFKSQTSHI